MRRGGAPQGYDLRPRSRAAPSAAARPARRRERSELVPVGAAFSVPFLAGQKGDIPTGYTSRMAAERQEFVYVFLPNHLVKSGRKVERDGGQCDGPQLRQGGRCLRSWTGGRSGRTAGRCRVGPAATEGATPGPVRSLRIGRASRGPCHRCTGTASPFRIANRPFPHLQPSVSTNSQGSPGGDL
jgi:hypothetical protein